MITINLIGVPVCYSLPIRQIGKLCAQLFRIAFELWLYFLFFFLVPTKVNNKQKHGKKNGGTNHNYHDHFRGCKLRICTLISLRANNITSTVCQLQYHRENNTLSGACHRSTLPAVKKRHSNIIKVCQAQTCHA